jgi:polysaccharide biosynthesis transport protein
MTKSSENPAEDNRRGRDLVVIPPEGRHLVGQHPSAARSPEGEEGGRGSASALGLYLHAFRRHWPLAISLGLLCAIAAMIPAWFLSEDKYTSVALLQISVETKNLLEHDRQTASNFEIFKSTQQQLITSDNVLIAALRKPEAASLPVIQKEDDPVRWLAKNIHVDFPGNAEIMRVGLSDTNPDEAATLVGAVVDAYMSEAVYKERDSQRERLRTVEGIYTDKEAEIRRRRTEVKQLAEQIGTADPGALAIKQQLAIQQLAEAGSELGRRRSELERAQNELALARQRSLAVAAERDVADAYPVLWWLYWETYESGDQGESSDADPIVAGLKNDIEGIDRRLTEIRKQAKKPLASQLTEELEQDREKLARRLADREKKLKKTATAFNPYAGLAELESRVKLLKAEEEPAAKRYEEMQKKADRLGSSSVDVDMMRHELQYLENSLLPIADERERLKVELRSGERISVFQKAEPPKSTDGKARLQAVAAAGCGGFFCVAFLVLFWDVRKQRINSLADLSRGLGLTVVGTMPLLPKKAARAGRAGKRQRKWQNSLNHAVDSIAARLFLRKDSGGVRVVMVSSAIQGEGKTTLAVQLATRLARSGESTLLVDYDLRRPSIHRIFGAPRGPGVCECLNKEFDLGQVVRATETENLSVVTAGDSLLDLLGPLSNGVTTSFFEKARAGFSFVVVDASPILPVIDGLLVSQHADTVVLSVRRDTSQAPQVIRACERLAAFGSRRYVAVLTGSHEEVCPDYHEHVISARVEGLGKGRTAENVENVETAGSGADAAKQG